MITINKKINPVYSLDGMTKILFLKKGILNGHIATYDNAEMAENNYELNSVEFMERRG